MALTVISISNRRRLINTFERKKTQITQNNDIAYFSENGVKNDYSMLKQMKNSLWMTSTFRTSKNDKISQ